MCIVLLPPGVNPIAVNKYIYRYSVTAMKLVTLTETFLDKCLSDTGSTEHSKGNKTVPGKVATTHTEDGHKQNTKTCVTI
jgi:hypothetical protein